MTEPDLSEFFKLSVPRKPPCKVGLALEQVKGQDKTNLLAAISRTDMITPGAIEKWLAARDIPMTIPAVQSHRAGRCTCHD